MLPHQEKHKFQKLTLTLGKTEPRLKLCFKIRKTKPAQLWAQCIFHAIKNGGIDERDRFCNFSIDPQEEIEKHLQVIHGLIENIKALHPEIDFGRIDFSNIQNEVNRLHVNFADRHLVKKDLLPTSEELWKEFNSRLHQMETIFRRTEIEKKVGIRNADLTLTFKGTETKDLDSEDFEEAVLFKSFGVCYLEYSQVGRNIVELFTSKDTEVPKDHIQPFTTMSANSYFWFGHQQGHSYAKEFEAKLKDWFLNGPIPFEKYGFSWNRKKLGIGLIPVASLEESFFSENEIRELQNEIYKRQYVFEVEVE
jgi:hypothetical protein